MPLTDCRGVPVSSDNAQALARLVVRDGGATPRERVAFALRRCLSRPGTGAEIERMLRLLAHARERYEKDRTAATAMATKPLGPLPAGADVVELAAWTVASNVLDSSVPAFCHCPL